VDRQTNRRVISRVHSLVKGIVMDSETALWLLGLVLSFILGWFTNWYFYRKQRKEGESAMKVLEQLQQYNDTVTRLGNDKRGKIIKSDNGTYGIVWTLEFGASVSVGATPRIDVEKGDSKTKKD
jgi:preprotein translocase subunit YajC